MLRQITIECPKCRQSTGIAVATPDEKETTFSTTACRKCRAPFVTATQKDGRILILDPAAAPGPSGLGMPNVLAIIGADPTRSGYRIKPPEHLGIFDRGVPLDEPEGEEGVSDEDLLRTGVTTSDRFLRRPDGSRRPPAEAAKYVGWRSVWVAQLNEALRSRLAAPPPLSFPPAIFISYRWGTEAENEWTARLAQELKSRGYPVVFDREEPKDLDVPELVSKIADCRYFLALVDPGYAERIGGAGADEDAIKDGWVFDEYNTAAFLSNHDQIRILGLWRAGASLPRGFREPAPGVPGNVLDVRTPEQLSAVLDDAFPPITDAPSVETVQRARSLLRESYQHVCAGRFQEAFVLAEELTALLPEAIDGPAQKLRIALQAGSSEAALAAAEEALALAPESPELLVAAGTSACGAGCHRPAVEYLGRFLEARGEESRPWEAQAHLALGSSLDEFDQVHPALAHLEVARSLAAPNADLLNTLGYVYRRAGEPERAVERLQEGLRLDPSHAALLVNLTNALAESARYPEARVALAELAARVPDHPAVRALGPVLDRAEETLEEPPQLIPQVLARDGCRWIVCDECEARVPVEPEGVALCARCGSALPVAQRVCPLCQSDGRVFPAPLPGVSFQCPYCRQGKVSMADG